MNTNQNFTWEDVETSTNRRTFFKLDDGQTEKVRVLINGKEDLTVVKVHDVRSADGNNFATVLCNEGSNDGVPCKYCAAGNKAKYKVVLPIYMEATGEICYWLRTVQWVQTKLESLIDQVAEQNQTFSGQVLTITRKGNGLNTEYSIVPVLNTPNDNKKMDEFGEIVTDVMDIGLIKPANYELETTTENDIDTQKTETRRTTDVFN